MADTIIQQFPVGFGSYLAGILPPDVATAAGAFGVSVGQIKNITTVPVEKFAQVVTNIETIAGLPVNGTNVPVDTTLVSGSLPLIALGSGPYGTYTMSDFFGCMTGLPYIGIDIQGLIQALETPTLYNIYKQLYLAVTWEQATATWNGTSFTYTDRGGGYGREGASAPAVTVGGNPAIAIIGTDTTNITTFGRIISISYTGPADTVVIAPPPGTGLFSNSIIQGYIDDANAEILSIQTTKPLLAEQLNTNWNYTGTQLTIEQRALDTGLPVPVPPATEDIVPDLAQFPTTQISFTDSIPQFALNTDPHMQAQTIEAIANICTPGGQSIVGMMREARNQARLNTIGVPLDNNINDTITPVQNKELVANGSVANSAPAKLGQVNCDTGDEINPSPYGFYDPNDNNYYVTNPNFSGSTLAPVVDTGNSEVAGSFAGSLYTNLIPSNLNVLYTSNNLLPSTYTIAEAIDDVIRCNCDCWDLI